MIFFTAHLRKPFHTGNTRCRARLLPVYSTGRKRDGSAGRSSARKNATNSAGKVAQLRRAALPRASISSTVTAQHPPRSVCGRSLTSQLAVATLLGNDSGQTFSRPMTREAGRYGRVCLGYRRGSDGVPNTLRSTQSSVLDGRERRRCLSIGSCRTLRPAAAIAADAHTEAFDDTAWLPVDVPGDVHTALIAAGRIADPFYDRNEPACAWVEDREWWYRLAFRGAGGALCSPASGSAWSSPDWTPLSRSGSTVSNWVRTGICSAKRCSTSPARGVLGSETLWRSASIGRSTTRRPLRTRPGLIGWGRAWPCARLNSAMDGIGGRVCRLSVSGARSHCAGTGCRTYRRPLPHPGHRSGGIPCLRGRNRGGRALRGNRPVHGRHRPAGAGRARRCRSGRSSRRSL